MKCEHEVKKVKVAAWCKKCGAIKETDRWTQPQNNEDLITIKKATWYECYSCNQTYKDEEQARNCCELEQEPRYACPQCNEIYEDMDDARHCCSPDEVEGYICPECGEFFEDKTDAMECCQM